MLKIKCFEESTKAWKKLADWPAQIDPIRLCGGKLFTQIINQHVDGKEKSYKLILNEENLFACHASSVAGCVID